LLQACFCCQGEMLQRIAMLHLVIAILLVVDVDGKTKQPLPVAVEARFKERITSKLTAALDQAVGHLATALGVQEESQKGDAFFGRHYELDVLDDGHWRSGCATDVDATRDSVSHCAIRKLQAMTALCETPAVAEKYKTGINRLLKQLLRNREKVIAGLGVKRSLLPLGNGIEAWMSEVAPGSGNYDVVIPLHAAAMLAVVQCGSALNQQEVFSDVQAWFTAITKAYTREHREQQSFHSNAILWESFVKISSLVREGSSFAEELQDFLEEFEAYLQVQFDKDPRVWSFSGARAAVLSHLMAKKAARRKKFGKIIDEYMKRWKQIAPQMKINEMYTCGPLQGLAPLLLRRGDQAAELVSSVLAMAEKDVDLFQVTADRGDGTPSQAAQRLGDAVLTKQGALLEGAFFRDQQQLVSEKRTSVRVDDTAQCVMALTRTLQLLDDLVGVEVEDPAGASSTPADAQHAEAGRTDL